MNFLFPLYLLGALAIAVPIVLHLRKRPPKEHMSFGSLMFLEKSPERLTRRTRIERWLLLALRCLALLAFAFLFGRPYLPALSLPSEAETNLRALVIVDSSASMRREDLWGQAVKLAEETIRSYDAGASVGVGFFDESLEIVGDDPAWKGLSPAARVGELQKAMAARGEDLLPGWKRTDLGRSLVQSMDWLSDDGEDDGSGRRELVVISDFQEGSDRTELNQIAWPENVAVRCLGVEPGDEANLSLSLAAQKTENSLEAQNSWRVRVSSSRRAENRELPRSTEFLESASQQFRPFCAGSFPSRMGESPGNGDGGLFGSGFQQSGVITFVACR